MTQALSKFDDIGQKRFVIPERRRRSGIAGCLVFERGTRSFSTRLQDAGIKSYGDLENMSVAEIIALVPTTRPNLDRAIQFLRQAGVSLI